MARADWPKHSGTVPVGGEANGGQDNLRGTGRVVRKRGGDGMETSVLPSFPGCGLVTCPREAMGAEEAEGF